MFGLELKGEDGVGRGWAWGKGLEQSYTGLGHVRSNILCCEATSQVTGN